MIDPTSGQALQEDYDRAVKEGHKMRGYMGHDLSEYSKEQLEKICTILWDHLERSNASLVEARKKIFG